VSASSFHTNAESWCASGIAALLVRCFSDTQRRHDEALRIAEDCLRWSERAQRFSKIGGAT